MHRSAELTLIDKTKDGILSQQLWQFEKPVLEVAAEKRLKIHCVDDEGEKKKNHDSVVSKAQYAQLDESPSSTQP